MGAVDRLKEILYRLMVARQEAEDREYGDVTGRPAVLTPLEIIERWAAEGVPGRSAGPIGRDWPC